MKGEARKEGRKEGRKGMTLFFCLCSCLEKSMGEVRGIGSFVFLLLSACQRCIRGHQGVQSGSACR